MKEIRQHTNQTGGGPPINLELNPLENRIVQTVGKDSLDGDENVGEIGFGTMPRKEQTPLKEQGNIVTPRKRLFDDEPTRETSTPKTPKMTPSNEKTTPKFSNQQHQVEQALALQRETNRLLTRVVEQNDKILEHLNFIRTYFQH